MKINVSLIVVNKAIERMNLSQPEQARILAGLDAIELTKQLADRLGDYADEWLQEEINRFLEKEE